MSEAHKPVAYLKFWAYQQVAQDGNVNADEGLEVCRAGEVGADGYEAFPVYDKPQTLTPPDGWDEAVELAKSDERIGAIVGAKPSRINKAIIDIDAKLKEQG